MVAMDVYSTSFTHPRQSPFIQQHSHSPTSSIDFTPDLRTPRDNYPPSASPAHPSRSRIPLPSTENTATPYLGVSSEYGVDAVHQVCVEAMATHGCHVSFTRVDEGRAWNFHITGGYQQVMAARGMILNDCPVQVTWLGFVLQIRQILTLTTFSGSSGPLRPQGCSQ